MEQKKSPDSDVTIFARFSGKRAGAGTRGNPTLALIKRLSRGKPFIVPPKKSDKTK